MKCVSCGAPIDMNSASKYIRCAYCNSYNSNFSSFEKLELKISTQSSSTDISYEKYRPILVSYKLGDYVDVRALCQRVTEENSSDWIALTYLAIAQFWLGYNDFYHLDNISTTLEKARILSANNELVVDASNKIANNIVVLASKNQIYGDELKSAIYAFKVAETFSNLESEAKIRRDEYIQKAFSYLQGKLNDLLQRNKADYDPPYNTLINVWQLATISNDKKFLEFFYLHGNVHLGKCQSKSYFMDLKGYLYESELKLKEINSDIVGKRIVFGFMGKVSIK